MPGSIERLIKVCTEERRPLLDGPDLIRKDGHNTVLLQMPFETHSAELRREIVSTADVVFFRDGSFVERSGDGWIVTGEPNQRQAYDFVESTK